jgi:ABC-type antimicrobial peptide transport system permease subunit
MYIEIRAAVIMISVAFSIAIAISIYMAWRAYRESSREEVVEGEISL